MIRGKRFLAVVPARGGSKGIPKKNIQPLAGRPLLFYTLDQAKAVPILDMTVVSTDCAEIKAVAQADGARVIDRPAELAGDQASTEVALLHALDVLDNSGEAYDYVVVLEPTSPFRTAESISGCCKMIVEENGTSLLSVVKVNSVVGGIENNFFRPLIPDQPRRRQDRQSIFMESSTVYVCRVDFLRNTGTLVTQDWLAYPVSKAEAVDINTPQDFKYANSLMDQRA